VADENLETLRLLPPRFRGLALSGKPHRPGQGKVDLPAFFRQPAEGIAIMTITDFREYCATLPHSIETFPFDSETLVPKVGGRMYALANIHAVHLSINLKCDPIVALDLRAAFPGIVLPGWHMNKEHWNTVVAEYIPDEKLVWMIRHSYDCVVAGFSRRKRAELFPGIKAEKKARL
jgi:predicted DNA-binding protein (MmcQ/YjbR family)